MVIVYAANGKRDFHSLEAEFDDALKKLKEEERWRSRENQQLVIEYLAACKLGMVKSGGKNKKVSKGTLYRVMGILRLLSEEWIKKDFKKTTADDWTSMYIRMEEGDIKSDRGKPYLQSSKAKNYKTIRKFLKYLGMSQYAENWDVTEEVPTKEFITRPEVERMISGASLKIKCVTMLMFDGGFRAEEFANLRWADLRKDEGKQYYQAHVRKETSKTKRERYVSLWLATDLLDAYKTAQKEKLKDEFDENAFIYEGNYASLVKGITRLGKRTINRHVTPHTLRHSSGTYYSNVVRTYQNFCGRYGWSLKSGIAQRYWHRVDDGEVADQAKEHEIARFKTEFERVRVQNDVLSKEQNRVMQENQQLKEEFDDFKERFEQKSRMMEQFFKKMPPKAMEQFFKEFMQSGEADSVRRKYEQKIRAR